MLSLLCLIPIKTRFKSPQNSMNMFGYFENEGLCASTTTAVAHLIVTQGTVTCSNPHRLSMAERCIEEEIDKMLSFSVIRPSRSGYAIPVVLVPKLNRIRRFFVHYRKHHQHTKSESIHYQRWTSVCQ
eukprot:NODE_183_length_15731_cov_0.226778.p10 type:complete len:128 gc:universal NODE_183_length_15731_cov_0.226778:12367-11984(-)